MEFEEKLTSGVGRALGFGVAEAAESIAGRKLLPQGSREIGHLFDGAHTLLPDPIEDLIAAVGGLVEFLQEGEEFLSGQAMEGVGGHEFLRVPGISSPSRRRRCGQNLQN